jgi:hypothetical protein
MNETISPSVTGCAEHRIMSSARRLAAALDQTRSGPDAHAEVPIRLPLSGA